jgi:hypothetical protein
MLVSQRDVVKVERVVEVSDWPVVELVEHANVVDQGLQRLEDGWEFQKSMNLENRKINICQQITLTILEW